MGNKDQQHINASSGKNKTPRRTRRGISISAGPSGTTNSDLGHQIGQGDVGGDLVQHLLQANALLEVDDQRRTACL
jgi:hypothetical protein